MIADPALVLINYQNDFCKPGFAVAQEADVSHVQPALERAGELLDRYRESGRGRTPILVRSELPEEALLGAWAEKLEERPFDSICAPGSEGTAIVPELDVRPSDRIVTKRRYSAFYNTDLDLFLSTNDVTNLVVAVVSTNVCVESTVRAAYDPTGLRSPPIAPVLPAARSCTSPSLRGWTASSPTHVRPERSNSIERD